MLQERSKDYWFVDETTILLQTRLKRVVAPTGTTPVLPIRYSRQSIKIIGGFRQSGRFLYTIVERLTQDTIKRFLIKLKKFKGKGQLHIIWDGASTHVAHSVQYRASRLGIYFIQQPPYCPEVQPVEEIWRQLKASLANWFFSTREELNYEVEAFFQRHNHRFALDVVNYFC